MAVNNSYTQPDDGLIITQNAYMQLISRLLTMYLCLTDKWLASL